MPNNILFIFEGERTEIKITKSLTQFFINENTIVQCAYCNDIYELHKEIAADEDLDTFLLLKEFPANQKILSAFSPSDFAEIYLFFDYDGHDTIADDEKVKEVLNFFNEETTKGKLFISYPMVEAFRHYSSAINFQTLKVKAKENINYKQMVGEQTDHKLNNLNRYTLETWKQLIELHLSKMNDIVNDNYTLPESIISQLDIFLKQEEKFIKIDSTVAVLSSFPVFIFDYYGSKYISELLNN